MELFFFISMIQLDKAFGYRSIDEIFDQFDRFYRDFQDRGTTQNQKIDGIDQIGSEISSIRNFKQKEIVQREERNLEQIKSVHMAQQQVKIDREPSSFRPVKIKSSKTSEVEKNLESKKTDQSFNNSQPLQGSQQTQEMSKREEPSNTEKPLLAVPSDAAPSEGENSFGLTGDWRGYRSNLNQRGIDLAAIYKSEVSRVMSGGLERKTNYLQNLDLKLLLNADKWIGWRGTTFFFYGLGDWGASAGYKPSKYVGDAQGTSNIETVVDNFKLYEAWMEKALFADKLFLLVGIHDLNSDFYVTESSSLFLHASFGVGRDLSQTGVMGPSIFPYTSTAIRVKVEPNDSFYIQSALFNAHAGDPDAPSRSYYRLNSENGFLLINEMATVGRGEHAYKYGLGYWAYTQSVDHLSLKMTNSHGQTEPVQVNNSGIYFLVDQSFSSSLSAFVCYGTASTQPNKVKDNFSIGVLKKGLGNWREKDKIGFAFSRASSSTDSQAPQEMSFELSYRIEIIKGLSLQPDLQFIKNPDFSDQVKNAFIAGIRLELGL